ncbi:MAG TPA: penicillin-binding protein 2, partial [Pseudomonadales bacterium]
MKANKTETADFQWRFLAVVAGFIALALGLACRSVFLHVINQDFLIHEGDMRTLRLQEITAHRGIIKDRRQKPLAVSSPVASVWVKPKEMMESRQQWKELAKLCKMPYGQLKDIVLSNQNKSFVYLKRHISPQQAEQIKALDIAGVNTIKEYRRFYPSGEIAAHVVGMTNIDDVGQEGLELAYGESLQGLPGKKRVLKDRKGRVIQDLDIIKTAEPGQDLVLSIDLRAQHIAYRELLAAVRAHKADS